jgi:hypothetical protein
MKGKIMNPATAKVSFVAVLITDENKDELTAEFDSKDVMSATNLPGTPDTFVPGWYAVIRHISADDPFVESLGCKFSSVWITSREMFESKFTVTGRNRYQPSTLLIAPK